MQIFLCEDEVEQISIFHNLIKQIEVETQWNLELESFTNAEALLLELENRIISNEKLPEIIFSDIKMDGMNGISFGKELCQIAPQIYLVYLTAFEEYAIYGYEARAYRYLLKPAKTEEIKRILLDLFFQKEREKNIIVEDVYSEKIISLREIFYFSAENKYVMLHTTRGDFLDRRSLQYYEEALSSEGFFRIHRKYLINMRYHKAIKNGKIILKGNNLQNCPLEVSLPISRRKEMLYHTCFLKMLEKGIFQ